jgi:hypothetical protein
VFAYSFLCWEFSVWSEGKDGGMRWQHERWIKSESNIRAEDCYVGDDFFLYNFLLFV